jgi:hypothetical protein
MGPSLASPSLTCLAPAPQDLLLVVLVWAGCKNPGDMCTTNTDCCSGEAAVVDGQLSSGADVVLAWVGNMGLEAE